MVCQAELTSHLLTAAFDSVAVSEMVLTAQLVEQTPDHTLALFDKGFIPSVCCTNGTSQ